MKDCGVFRAAGTNMKLNECINLPNTSLNKKVNPSGGRGTGRTAKPNHSGKKYKTLLISAAINICVGCSRCVTWKMVIPVIFLFCRSIIVYLICEMR